MPTFPTYPGVYIEEVPSGVHAITAVATSIGAFIGNFSRGPIGQPVRLFSATDFEREFGGLRQDSLASYGIQQFFLNGGSQAWVVRTAGGSPAAAAADVVENALTVTARNEGTWGNNLRVELDPGPIGSFHMTVREIVNGQSATSERFLNLSGDPASTRSVVRVLEGESRLVRANLASALTDPPPPSGTSSRTLTAIPDLSGKTGKITIANESPEITIGAGQFTTMPGLAAALQTAFRSAGLEYSRVTVTSHGTPPNASLLVRAGTSDPEATVTLTGDLAIALGFEAVTRSKELTAIPDLTGKTFKIRIDTESAEIDPGIAAEASVEDLATALQSAFRTAGPEYGQVSVTANGVLPAATLIVHAGTADPGAQVVLTGSLATELGFDAVAGGTVTAQSIPLENGSDGTLPGAAELTAALSGFDRVDLINILCIPDTDRLADTPATQVIAAATAYAESRRAFYIVDIPNGDSTRDTIPEAEAWLSTAANPRHPNAAAYFPRPRVADPLDEFRLRSIPASGTIAGLYARTDGARGVWKAPAGLEATLRGVQEFELNVTDAENGVLNPLGLNCLRTFRVAGNVSWGARTLRGADLLASEWKYVPVRRLALFLEESLSRGTQFAVFEPNDEPLWSQIRLNVGSFMQSLFVQGAFQGATPRQAYLVKCDSETTSQDDINHGVVNILVGFAPLVPAEFVIVRIQQLAGQTE